MYNEETGRILRLTDLIPQWRPDFVAYLYNFLPLTPGIATDLALFHSIINIAGAIIMIFLSDWLAVFLSKRFTKNENKNSEFQSKYLDENLLGAP